MYGRTPVLQVDTFCSYSPLSRYGTYVFVRKKSDKNIPMSNDLEMDCIVLSDVDERESFLESTVGTRT